MIAGLSRVIKNERPVNCPGSLIATMPGRSDFDWGFLSGDKSVWLRRLVKGGAAKPARRSPGPIGYRFASHRASRVIHRLKELGGGRVPLRDIRAQCAVQHLLECLADIITAAARRGELVGGLFCQHLLHCESWKRW